MPGFSAGIDSLTSSGNFPTGMSAGLMRFTAANSCSSGTVGLILLSVTRFRSSVSEISLAFTNPLEIDVALRNARTGSGISEVAAGISGFSSCLGAFVATVFLDFAEAFFLVTIFLTS
jgi:hypothetical protein